MKNRNHSKYFKFFMNILSRVMDNIIFSEYNSKNIKLNITNKCYTIF